MSTATLDAGRPVIEVAIAEAMATIERRKELGAAMRAKTPKSKACAQKDALDLSSTDTTTTTQAYLAALRCDPCSYCGAAGGILDHIHPLLRKGTRREQRGERDERQRGADSWTNLTGACYSCNATKGPKTLLGHLGFGRWERKELLAELQCESLTWRTMGLGER